MWKSEEGSTQQLLQLCFGYFIFYVITGITVKYFQGSAELGFPGMTGMQYSTYSTMGGMLLCMIIVFAFGWYRLQSNRRVTVGNISFPKEYYYIIPSGICTAIIIPTTTLMYSLPISVMVAMIIMRGSVIIISRLVDTIQLRQGILKRKVFFEENIAVVFALLAVAIALLVNVFTEAPKKINPNAIPMSVGVIVLISYISAYAVRIYIMNYFKNTRAKGVKLDNKGFFGTEQISAGLTLLIVGTIIFFSPSLFGWENVVQIKQFRGALLEPLSLWAWAIFGGMFFGAVAVFSVFIFLFKGRSATFAGLVNRLTSLVAGTVATLTFAVFFGGKMPKYGDWASLLFIFIAVGFLSRAERKRTMHKGEPPSSLTPAKQQAIV